MGKKKADLERPAVTINKAGVSSVRPSDILRSRVGQEEIRKGVEANIYSPRRSSTSGKRRRAVT